MSASSVGSVVVPSRPSSDHVPSLAWWHRLGLQLRMQFLIQGCLILVLLAAQHWVAEHFEREMLKGAEERATAVADGAINGLNTLMVTRLGGNDVISDAKARKLFIDKMGASDGLLELRVVRGKGTDAEFGPGLPEEQARDDMDRAVLADGKPLFTTLAGSNGEPRLRGVLPFVAMKEFRTSRCLECHAVNEGTVLGAASVTIDIAGDMADIRRMQAALWAGQAVLQVVLFVIIGFVVRRLLRLLGGEPEYAVRIARSIASGDLGAAIDCRNSDRASLLRAMNDMRDSLAATVGEVRSGATEIAAASSQIATGNLDLSRRTEQQASSLERTAASMEELSATVRQNAEHAREANDLATSACEVAARGGAVVSEVVDALHSLQGSSRQIADITGVIDSIAFQTNILALNASVEAARAGQHGRGFAVVATEVRSLSQRCATAAQEIKTLIADSVSRMEAGGQLADEAGGTMQDVVQGIRKVAQIVGEIAVASQQQTTGIEQVNQAIGQIDDATQLNASLVEEAAAAAASLREQAQRLSQLMGVFKLNDGCATANGVSV